MFVTEKSTELFLSSTYKDDEMQWWPYLSLFASIPFYMVVIEKVDEKGPYRETLMMASVTELLVTQQLTKIHQVSLVSPDLVNKKGEWQANLITEIIEGVKPDTDVDTSLVFVLKNGQRYIDSIRGLKESDLLKRRVVFKLRYNPS